MPSLEYPAAALRSVNERLLTQPAQRHFFCECGTRRCTARLALERGEFERLSWIEGARVVARGHWRRGEHVLITTSRYLVVCDATR